MDLERNGLVFKDLPSDVVTFIHQEFQKLDSEIEDLRTYSGDLENAARTDADSIENLSTELTETQSYYLQEKERADALDECLERTDSLLEEIGLRRDSDGNYYQDAKKKMPPMMEDPDEDEDEDMEDPEEEADETPEEEMDEEPEEEVTTKKVAVKTKKKVKKDSLSSVLKAWKEADKIIPGLSESDRFDSSLSVAGVHRLVIAQLRPERKLEGRDDSYVEGVYEELVESYRPQQRDRTDSLDTFISLAAKNGAGQPNQTLTDRDKALSEAWKQPMAMSRSN